jgi:hypothetical protein
MTHTVVGLFGSLNTAQDAVKDLRAAGFEQRAISIVGRAGPVSENADVAPPAAAGAGVGAASGALLGGTAGLLASIGVLAIPGFGPLLAAGPLVAILTGAGAGAAVGAVAGGLVGALIVAGVPEAEAHRYAESVRAGGTLVTVSADEARADAAAEILRRCGSLEVGMHGRLTGEVAGRHAEGVRPDGADLSVAERARAEHERLESERGTMM